MTRLVPTAPLGFGPDTPVLLSDGTIVSIESLRVGDFVMGLDSTPRRVTETFRNQAPLYKVVPIKGAPWFCAATTALTVSDRLCQTRDVSAEYLFGSWSRGSTRGCRLFRQGVDFPSAIQPFDPYLIGLWIGDGDRGGARITTADPEIVRYLETAAAQLGMHCQANIKKKDRHRAFPPRTISLALEGHGKGECRNRNPWRTFVRTQCVLDGSKSIPSIYLIADRRQRLSLLAGILDTDGWYDKPRSDTSVGMYEVSTVFPILRDQILFLARSLGFAANSSETLKGNQTPGFVGLYHRLSIRGDLHEIPCLLPRKQAPERRGSHRTNLTGFRLAASGDGSCFGIKLDGDERFLLGDFTAAYAGMMVRRRAVRSRARLRLFGRTAA